MPKSKIEESVEITACLDLNTKVIAIDGDGAAKITFTTSAEELAKVLTVFTKFHKRRISLKLKGLPEDIQSAGRNKDAKTYR
jgi:ACT domain-containing protein